MYMEDSFSESYRQLMNGFSNDFLMNQMPNLNEDGSFVILSADGYNNNGEATVVATKND